MSEYERRRRSWKREEGNIELRMRITRLSGGRLCSRTVGRETCLDEGVSEEGMAMAMTKRGRDEVSKGVHSLYDD